VTVYEVKIDQGERGPNDHSRAYFPSIRPIVTPPGIWTDTTVGYTTQDAAIIEIERKLKFNFRIGENILYGLHPYFTTIDDAVAAIKADKPLDLAPYSRSAVPGPAIVAFVQKKDSHESNAIATTRSYWRYETRRGDLQPQSESGSHSAHRR
jgi:hypothetical protein